MKPLRTLLAAIVTACGLVLVSPAPPASACSCVISTTAEYVGSADTVFAGTLTRLPEAEDYSADPVTYGFDVHRVYQGQVGASADLTSAGSGASCGLEGMAVGTTYLMFAEATRRQDGLSASLCGGSQRVTPEFRDRVEALLGPGSTPHQVPSGTDAAVRAETSEDGTVLYALLGLSAAVLTAIGWVLLPGRGGTSRSDAALS